MDDPAIVGRRQPVRNLCGIFKRPADWERPSGSEPLAKVSPQAAP